ncbi:MAG: peptide-methionine (S)-S-oxide reductase MsrA [Pseudomonadota bacterium]
MKNSNPLTLAFWTGGLATLAAFFLSAGAQNAPIATPANANVETAIFAGGCFWCVESDFDKVEGVLETVSGYIGGRTDNPTYYSHGKDGHFEAVRVVYDSSKVEYGELVDYFMRHIDPTDDGGQFCDRGNSYRTAVFVENQNEREEVEAQFSAIQRSGALPAPIVTQILDETAFYEAEAFHQNYYQKNPIRYRVYRAGCKRDQTVARIWSGAGNS